MFAFINRILIRRGESLKIMRYTGKLTSWKDDKGFGFITSNTSGELFFVHFKSILSRHRRPVLGDTMTYEVLKDEKDRKQAVKVLYRGEDLSTFSHMYDNQSFFYDNIFPYLVVGGFISLLIALLLLGLLPLPVLALYFGMSLSTFAVYFQDKSSAQNEQQRTPEKRLHFYSLIGGWPGALMAMKVCHHKSKKKSFQNIFWMTVFSNCFILVIHLTPWVHSIIKQQFELLSGQLSGLNVFFQ